MSLLSLRGSACRVLLLSAAACGGTTDDVRDAGSTSSPAVDASSSDAGEQASDGAPPDAGEIVDGGPPVLPDASVDAATPVGCGDGPACSGDTPICTDGICAQCSETDASQCVGEQICDLASQRCVDGRIPFELDCAQLAQGATCQGGPREVLLAAHTRGLVAMFDPVDGRFLGYWKNERMDDAFGSYALFTQGPDQCIWSVYQGERSGIERWQPDGAYLDEIIPLLEHFEGPDAVVSAPQSLAFSRDELLVASTRGTPAPRIARFALDGSYLGPRVADGSVPSSLLWLRNQTLFVGDQLAGAVMAHGPAGQAGEPLLSGVEPAQLAHGGAGRLLVADRGDPPSIHDVDLTTGSHVTAVLPQGSGEPQGVAALRNGGLLVTGERVGVLAAAGASELERSFEVGWDDLSVDAGSFRLVGRACLPEAVVAGAARPAEDSCPARVQGEPLIDEGFELGSFEVDGGERHFAGFYEAPGGSGETEVDAGSGANGSERSLHLLGTGGPHTGLAHALMGATPAYVGYFLRAPLAVGRHGYLGLQTGDGGYAALLWLENGDLRARHSRVSLPLADGAWHRIELRNIDWQRGDYDLYVDCQRIAEDIPLEVASDAGAGQLVMFNVHAATTSWFDDITVR